MSKKAQQLAARYGKKLDIIEAWEEIIRERQAKGENITDYTSEINVIPAFNAPMCSVITDSEEIRVMQWGLIPSITKNIKEKDRYVKGNWFRNARSEDIFITWPYKYQISSKRCLFPSTGYYEYHHNTDKTTTLYKIFVNNQFIDENYNGENEEDHLIFSIAGIWDTWLNPFTDEILESFSIITTAANELTTEIHNGGKHPNRMPLILNQEEERIWLDPMLDKDSIQSILKVYPAKKMNAYPISKDFRNRIKINKQNNIEF